MEQNASPMIINCVAYREGRNAGPLTLDEIGAALATEDSFVWLGLYEPDEELMRRVQREFGLHDLAVEDAHRAHQRPKLEEYGDALFVVMRTARLAGETVAFGETHLFVGRRYLVSIRHGDSSPYVDVRMHCEANPQLLAKGPVFVLYALMDFIVDQYFPIVDALEDDVTTLEEEIFGGSVGRRETTERIYRLRRDLSAIKRTVLPLVEICHRLMRFDLDVISDDTRLYFRDVYDHVLRINEGVDSLRDLLGTALDANLSLISVGQNDVMRKLAAWAAILAVPTMIAGLYGMNFHSMPALDWSYGYLLAVGVMGGICGFLYSQFKKAGWL